MARRATTGARRRRNSRTRTWFLRAPHLRFAVLGLPLFFGARLQILLVLVLLALVDAVAFLVLLGKSSWDLRALYWPDSPPLLNCLTSSFISSRISGWVYFSSHSFLALLAFSDSFLVRAGTVTDHGIQWIAKHVARAPVEAMNGVPVASLPQIPLDEARASHVVQFVPDGYCLGWETTVSMLHHPTTALDSGFG